MNKYRSVTVFEFSTSDGAVGFFIYQVVMSLSSKGLYISLVLRSVLSCNCSSCIESLHRYLSPHLLLRQRKWQKSLNQHFEQRFTNENPYY